MSRLKKKIIIRKLTGKKPPQAWGERENGVWGKILRLYWKYLFHPIWWCDIQCWEPAREFPPMTRSCRKALMCKASQGSRAPPPTPGSAWASTPKPESVCFTILWLSPTPLTLTEGYPQPPFSEENQLRALVNKSPGHNRSVSIQTPQMAL